MGDRTLTTTFRLLGADGSPRPGLPPISVINCHLSAGEITTAARRRLRQVHDALEAMRKARAKLPGAATLDPTIVCGDFNSDGDGTGATAVRELLTRGEVLPTYRGALGIEVIVPKSLTRALIANPEP